jgi:preprotein translocase subunit SecY
MAIASLVLGIVSLPCACFFAGFLLSVPAIIFGILGINSSKRGVAVAGIICGVAGLLVTIFMIVWFAMSWSDIVANPADYGLSEDYFENYTF